MSTYDYFIGLCLTRKHLDPKDYPATCAAYDEVIKKEYNALKGGSNAPDLEPANVSTPAPHK
jgi:hypothetical protein